MTSDQFVLWLKGYLEAAGGGPEVAAIQKALADVMDVPTYTAPAMPQNPPPYIPAPSIFQPNQCKPLIPPTHTFPHTIDLSKVYCVNSEGAAQ